MHPACRLLVYADSIQNPVMEAAGQFAGGDCLADRGEVRC